MRKVLIDQTAIQEGHLEPVVRWLADGGLAIFPTDTFYGLGANPFSETAVAALFDAKGRDERQAVPIIAASLDVVRQVAADWTDPIDRLARRFWPGPLSLVIAAPPRMAEALHGGLGTIAIRVPGHAVATAIAAAAGGLVTATSANLSGARPARAVHELDAIARDPRVLIVEAGETPGGSPSTIVDVRSGSPVLIRAGAVAWEKVMAAWGELETEN